MWKTSLRHAAAGASPTPLRVNNSHRALAPGINVLDPGIQTTCGVWLLICIARAMYEMCTSLLL